METQFKFISKMEAHKLIDEMPGNKVMVLTYNKEIGISDCGEYVKKKKGKKYIDRATVLVLAENNPIVTLNLHGNFLEDFSSYNKETIDKSILLSKLE